MTGKKRISLQRIRNMVYKHSLFMTEPCSSLCFTQQHFGFSVVFAGGDVCVFEGEMATAAE